MQHIKASGQKTPSQRKLRYDVIVHGNFWKSKLFSEMSGLKLAFNVNRFLSFLSIIVIMISLQTWACLCAQKCHYLPHHVCEKMFEIFWKNILCLGLFFCHAGITCKTGGGDSNVRIFSQLVGGICTPKVRSAQYRARGPHAARDFFCGSRELSQLYILLQTLDLE